MTPVCKLMSVVIAFPIRQNMSVSHLWVDTGLSVGNP
jgi:hypothetical protein